MDRDDLPDGGAAHFAEAIRRLKEIPGLLVEVLTPDFQGDAEAVRTVGRAGPDVFANNIETVRRLTPAVRDGRAGYDQTLGVLARMKREFPGGGHQVLHHGRAGGGRRRGRAVDARPARASGVEVLTLGQYLRPSAWHLPVVEFVTPEAFAAYERRGGASASATWRAVRWCGRATGRESCS